MPKLWSETVESHRSAVRDATLDATAALVAERGLTSVTMSEIAKRAGIGRATLYKYFPDVDSIVTAWHERQIGIHLEQLAEIRDHGAEPGRQLEAVLLAYAFRSRHDHDSEGAAVLHGGHHVDRAHQRLHALFEELIADGARAGLVRGDVPPGELATYCLHALSSATDLPSKAAVRRLVTVTLAGLTGDGPRRRQSG